MNVVAHAIQDIDGWIPQIRYMGARLDRLRPDTYVDGDPIWQGLTYHATPEDAVEVAQNRIDVIVKELFA